MCTLISSTFCTIRVSVRRLVLWSPMARSPWQGLHGGKISMARSPMARSPWQGHPWQGPHGVISHGSVSMAAWFPWKSLHGKISTTRSPWQGHPWQGLHDKVSYGKAIMARSPMAILSALTKPPMARFPLDLKEVRLLSVLKPHTYTRTISDNIAGH